MRLIQGGWVRVDRANRPPFNRCPICQRPDWCLVHQDEKAAICPRVLDGCVKDLGDAGYLHKLDGAPARVNLPVSGAWTRPSAVIDETPAPEIDAGGMASDYQEELDGRQLIDEADRLGVTPLSLSHLEMGWTGRAFSFPMKDPNGQIIGIRLRGSDGRKWAVPGSRNGLFIPTQPRTMKPLLIVEGPTETAAALTLGFDVIGRPSCNACVDMTADFVRRIGRPDVVIVANEDEPKQRPDGAVFYPGQEGAAKLADALCGAAKSVRVIYPHGHKDLRKWLNQGCTRDALLAVISNARYWTRRKQEPATPAPIEW